MRGRRHGRNRLMEELLFNRGREVSHSHHGGHCVHNVREGSRFLQLLNNEQNVMQYPSSAASSQNSETRERDTLQSRRPITPSAPSLDQLLEVRDEECFNTSKEVFDKFYREILRLNSSDTAVSMNRGILSHGRSQNPGTTETPEAFQSGHACTISDLSKLMKSMKPFHLGKLLQDLSPSDLEKFLSLSCSDIVKGLRYVLTDVDPSLVKPLGCTSSEERMVEPEASNPSGVNTAIRESAIHTTTSPTPIDSQSNGNGENTIMRNEFIEQLHAARIRNLCDYGHVPQYPTLPGPGIIDARLPPQGFYVIGDSRLLPSSVQPQQQENIGLNGVTAMEGIGPNRETAMENVGRNEEREPIEQQRTAVGPRLCVHGCDVPHVVPSSMINAPVPPSAFYGYGLRGVPRSQFREDVGPNAERTTGPVGESTIRRNEFMAQQPMAGVPTSCVHGHDAPHIIPHGMVEAQFPPSIGYPTEGIPGFYPTPVGPGRDDAPHRMSPGMAEAQFHPYGGYVLGSVPVVLPTAVDPLFGEQYLMPVGQWLSVYGYDASLPIIPTMVESQFLPSIGYVLGYIPGIPTTPIGPLFGEQYLMPVGPKLCVHGYEAPHQILPGMSEAQFPPNGGYVSRGVPIAPPTLINPILQGNVESNRRSTTNAVRRNRERNTGNVGHDEGSSARRNEGIEQQPVARRPELCIHGYDAPHRILPGMAEAQYPPQGGYAGGSAPVPISSVYIEERNNVRYYGWGWTPVAGVAPRTANGVGGPEQHGAGTDMSDPRDGVM